ncbi:MULTISPECIES: hypothetical protein [Stenotrophomonas maltophilia group]|uniref:hypothetical protein n=1 Tax=Stenotrophomonas maltophilia group TaxID=995085 RepID=UPI00066B828E|nr:hypothetical protein [Stenotrophomonas maltophilia]ELK2665307.1 hypothetical protein [Stenotrophomonas maltophilia]KUJ01647.1 hypothetical protein AR275_31070 [Stenotrophomonas maltophilia]MBH1376152.1 hypothetical protein [Stenotrophomonas maltophilia]MBH1439167.1 hypothetical protein [Stenotrophomonas maltophilia]MBH1557907.1 hypothetical protein [Stenotrophomonas maltophilia]
MRSTPIQLTAHPAPFEDLNADEIRAFFLEQPIQLQAEPAPFQGYTPEELDLLFAEVAAAPTFAGGEGKEH